MGMHKFRPVDKNAFHRHIPKRIQLLSTPKKLFLDTEEGMPRYTKAGIRQSALRGRLYNSDIAWPYLRRLIALKRMYKYRLSPERLQIIDRLIEAANATMYSKLANCAIDLKKAESARDAKKKKSWSSSEWKKHMDYLSQIAGPKKDFKPPPLIRGKSVPLELLLPRLAIISTRPDFKCYKKQTEEEWYRDPEKVSPKALKYEITDRTKKLAAARVIPRARLTCAWMIEDKHTLGDKCSNMLRNMSLSIYVECPTQVARALALGAAASNMLRNVTLNST